MRIPEKAQEVLRRLEGRGFAAYVVGGCVRDSLLGLTPGDWDICTAARPEETERCFSDCRRIETGLRHGTVTVLWQGEPFEITTFRRDGPYVGHRKPEQVAFVTGLEEDLARRDFTINAMALGLDGVIRDPFGGREDLERGLIRCVGDPDRRFQEDALRILRAMRFASRLGFTIQGDTADAMDRNRELLRDISAERVYQELCGILTGENAPAVLARFGPVIRVVLPEIGPAMGFLQHSRYHDKDVWGHTIEAIGKSKPDLLVRWALLLHDLGKPDTFTMDDQGVGHFYGHPQRGAEIARQVLTRLHAPGAVRDTVTAMVLYHEGTAAIDRPSVRRWIRKLGPETLLGLLEVKRADALAHVETPGSRRRYQDILAFTALTRWVLREEQCLTLRDLAVSGKDVLARGVAPGPRVGEILAALLEDVTQERCPNDRAALLARLDQMCEEDKTHGD